MPEVEPHEYQLGSPPASIVGIADMLLRRENLDPDVRTHVTAIRDLALDMVREAESPPARPSSSRLDRS